MHIILYAYSHASCCYAHTHIMHSPQVVLALPPDPVTGKVSYCIHWQREMRSNWQTLFILLTGKDLKGRPIEGLEPTHWWKQIIELTTSPKRPLGIKGSPDMLSKRACPCFAAQFISQCSCPHCTTFIENLDHRHLAVRCGWRKKSNSAAECDKCGGDCCDTDGTWHKMSAGVIVFTRSLLCPAVEVEGVFTSEIDPTTGFEIPGSRIPVKMVRRRCWLGLCPDCGWDKRFAKFPLLPLTIKEDEHSVREVFVRACPLEARLDLNTTYHEFQKMERGLTKDGKPYTQPEWVPVTANRREFYYRLYQFMEDFLPHYYKVLWHQAWDQVFQQQYKRLAFVGIPNQPQPYKSMKGLFIYCMFTNCCNLIC